MNFPDVPKVPRARPLCFQRANALKEVFSKRTQMLSKEIVLQEKGDVLSCVVRCAEGCIATCSAHPPEDYPNGVG